MECHSSFIASYFHDILSSIRLQDFSAKDNKDNIGTTFSIKIHGVNRYIKKYNPDNIHTHFMFQEQQCK